jgi:hypothetical protein
MDFRKMILVPEDKYKFMKSRIHTPPRDGNDGDDSGGTPRDPADVVFDGEEEEDASLKQQQQQCLSSKYGDPLSIEIILHAIPKPQKTRARALLAHIEHMGDLTWTSTGELVVNGEAVHNSHITDLVRDTVKKYKTGKPIGISEFYQALAERNIPLTLLGNSDAAENVSCIKKKKKDWWWEEKERKQRLPNKWICY